MVEKGQPLFIKKTGTVPLYRAVSRQSALEPSAEAAARRAVGAEREGHDVVAMLERRLQRAVRRPPQPHRRPLRPWPVSWCQTVQKAPRARPPLAGYVRAERDRIDMVRSAGQRPHRAPSATRHSRTGESSPPLASIGRRARRRR